MTRTPWHRSISGKTVIALILTFLSLTVIIFFLLHAIMLGSISKQEMNYVSEHIGRAENAIALEQQRLQQTAADWAVWTDTYEYMANLNEDFVSGNLTTDAFANIRINAMVFMAPDGNITYSSMASSENVQLAPIPKELEGFCGTLPVSAASQERTTGLLMLPESPLMYATCPILTSEGNGPARGVLLVGRYIDKAEIEMLAGSLKLDIQITPMENADTDVLALFHGDYTTKRIQAFTSDRINGYAVLNDIYGKPALLLGITTDREMSRIGRSGINLTVLSMAAACVLASLLLLAALSRLVLRRLRALCKDIKDIAEKKVLCGRLKLSSQQDELDIVSNEINAMLDTIEDSNRQIIDREESLHHTNIELQAEIVKRENAQNKIRHLAYHDGLTGLPNRTYLTEQLDHGIKLAQRIEKMLAVLFLDLDGFKMINDTMGHPAGDTLLTEVAKRLTHTVRKSDVIARLGGDEFIIMVENVDDVESVERIAAKVLQSFAQPFSVLGQECFITTSVGIAVHPTDGDNAETLLKNADIAMYKAKEKGKNQYVLCTYGIKAKVLETMKMANRMFRALENKEFLLYYQPQVSCGNNAIVGVEALIRWNHPDMGMVLPGEFISIAEQTGLIISIGEWVIRTACRQNKAWQDMGLPKIRMGVNLSIKQFQNHNIMREVEDILRETGMEPEYLEMEITESIAMREQGYVIDALNAMRAMGIHISIDDFGTEYSSMNHLKQLPVDKIKIPMPFVQGIDVSEKDKAITKSIIVLAKSLGLSVLAEGVETQQQNDFLACRMCDELQGFYHYKPMPAEEVEQLLRRQLTK